MARRHLAALRQEVRGKLTWRITRRLKRPLRWIGAFVLGSAVGCAWHRLSQRRPEKPQSAVVQVYMCSLYRFATEVSHFLEVRLEDANNPQEALTPLADALIAWNEAYEGLEAKRTAMLVDLLSSTAPSKDAACHVLTMKNLQYSLRSEQNKLTPPLILAYRWTQRDEQEHASRRNVFAAIRAQQRDAEGWPALHASVSEAAERLWRQRALWLQDAESYASIPHACGGAR